MDEVPQWIGVLMRSGLAHGCFESQYAPGRQQRARESVYEAIGDDEGRRQELRTHVLRELSNSDWRVVERAVAYLMTVGEPADADSLRALDRHPEECIRKGAKACAFELQRRIQ